MNMITIWSFAAWSTDEPPRIAPVIMPGIAIIPSTLIWLIVGVNASLSASVAIGLHASSLDAPNAK